VSHLQAELTLDPTRNKLTVVPLRDDENGDAAVGRGT